MDFCVQGDLLPSNQGGSHCLEPEHLELLMSVVERLSEEAAR